MSNHELHEVLLIEEADAWFEYADATKDERERGTRKSSPGPGRDCSSASVRSAPDAPGSSLRAKPPEALLIAPC